MLMYTNFSLSITFEYDRIFYSFQFMSVSVLITLKMISKSGWLYMLELFICF